MNTNRRLSPVGVAVLLACAGQSAQAFETIEFQNGARLETRINTTYTLSTRVEDREDLLARNTGGNDGNNNFDQWALSSNRLALLFDGKLSKALAVSGTEIGAVLSASYFYDDAYQGRNDNDPGSGRPDANYNPNGVNKEPPFNEFTSGAERYHGGYARLLDAYVYGLFDVGGRRLSTRLGRHVVSWGEALFFPGISLAQGPADGTKTGIPGTEVKDQLLPEDQVSFSLELTPDWSLLGHWQFQFQETLAPAPGSYLNTSDAVGPGGVCLGPWVSLPAVPTVFGGYTGCSFGKRGDDILPSDTGQWGLGTRYRITAATEVGLYYLNYSDRTPVPEINAFTPGTPVPAFFNIPGNQIGNGSYRVRYFEDVKLIGATASTSLGIVTVAGEISYKDGAPVLVNTVVNPATGATIPNPTEADVTQVNVNAFFNFGRTRIAPMTVLVAEVAWVDIGSIEARKAPGVENLPPPQQAFFQASDDPSFDTDQAWAASATGSLTYPNLFEGWDLGVAVAYSQQLSGRTLVGGVGGEGDRRFSVGFTFTRLSNLQLGLTYLGFAGGANIGLKDFKALTDRDQLSLTAKYSF